MSAEESTEVSTEVEGNTRVTSTSSVRSRAWFLTIFPKESKFGFSDSGEITKKLESLDTIYRIWQWETCPDTGRIHCHAMLYWKNPRQWPKKIFPDAHCEKVKNYEKCIQYCSKEESRLQGPFESGERPEQGRRTDLEEIAKKISDGGSLESVADENPEMFVRFHRGLKELKTIKMKHRDKNNPMKIFWRWGSTGVGKTRYVWDNYDDIYKKDMSKWWDGYEQQEVILIDEFEKWWDFRDFLQLIDRYPEQGQIKGGYVKINSKICFITSEYHPDHYFKDTEFDQVMRRIKDSDGSVERIK